MMVEFLKFRFVQMFLKELVKAGLPARSIPSYSEARLIWVVLPFVKFASGNFLW